MARSLARLLACLKDVRNAQHVHVTRRAEDCRRPPDWRDRRGCRERYCSQSALRSARAPVTMPGASESSHCQMASGREAKMPWRQRLQFMRKSGRRFPQSVSQATVSQPVGRHWRRRQMNADVSQRWKTKRTLSSSSTSSSPTFCGSFPLFVSKAVFNNFAPLSP